MDLLTGRSASGSDGSSTADGRHTRSRSTLLRRLVVATGIVVAIAYLASRRAGDGTVTPGVDEVRETVSDTLSEDPNAVEPGVARRIPIAEPGTGPRTDDRPADDDGTDDEHETIEAGDELAEGRSSEELAELADEDVDDSPAEPGEMSVDEEIVEDVVDEDVNADSEDDGDGSSRDGS